MSAVNLHQGSGPTQAKAASSADPRGYEPSMEEILASIRRIIADDQSLPGRGVGGTLGPAAPQAASAYGSAAPVEHAPAPVVMLRAAPEAAAKSAPQEPAHPTPTHQEPIRQELTHQELAHQELRDAGDAYHEMQEHGSISAPQFPSPNGTGTDLHGHEAYDEPEGYHDGVGGAPGTSEDGAEAIEGGPALFSPSTDHSVTAAFNTLAATRLADNSEDLLDLARDMIRPLLKSWLDDNLPSMVERMVRAEIERVARGGR